MIRCSRPTRVFLAGALVASLLCVTAWTKESIPLFLGSSKPDAAEIERWLAQSRQLEGSDFQEALGKARQALVASREQTLPRSELASLLQVGRAMRLLNDYSNALRTVQEGLLLAKDLHDEVSQGELFLLRGTIEWNQAKIPEATVSMMEARRIGESLGNKKLQIGALTGQGLVRARSDDLDAAQTQLDAALKLAEEAGDERTDSILNSLGCIHLQHKNYPSARGYFERALTLVRQGDNPRLTAYIMLNLGQLFTETGDQDQSGKYLNDAMVICRHNHLRRGMADIDYLLAGRDRRLGHFDEALAHLHEAMLLAESLKNPDLFVSIYQEYVLTAEARGDFESALHYTRELARQLETVRGEKSRRLAAEIQSRYEAESRGRQIKLLQRDKELQQTNLTLKDVEFNRVQTRYLALALIVMCGAITVVAFASRQRAVARLTRQMLAETRAAKEEVEVEDARKARLLTIAARDLSDSEARFRSAFESSALGVALVAIDGRWLRVNPALCRIVGYQEEELLAIDFQTITYPPDLNSDLTLLRQLLDGQIESYSLEKRYIHKEGRLVWIRLDVAVVRHPVDEQASYFVTQVQDIEERRKAQAQLHAAKEEAEKANEAKNEFLSRMSHELRTPLNAIIGFGQLLELQDFGERQNQSVGHILAGGRHLLELINEVLDITQIESGHFHFSCEPTLASEAVRNAVYLVQPLAEEAGVSIANGCEQEEPAKRIQADPRRLRQVLLNLLSNAIKYNRRGGSIEVRCYDRESRVCIEVHDTGVGMASSDLDKIFAPFTRLPATEEVPGTGLGLSLSKGLTETMGGRLEVRSELGRGSTFTLVFDRAPEGAIAYDVKTLILEKIPPSFCDG